MLAVLVAAQLRFALAIAIGVRTVVLEGIDTVTESSNPISPTTKYPFSHDPFEPNYAPDEYHTRPGDSLYKSCTYCRGQRWVTRRQPEGYTALEACPCCNPDPMKGVERRG